MLRKNSYSESQPNQSNNKSHSEELVIYDKLNQLEGFVINNNNVPLTPYKFINEDDLFEHLDELRETLPKTIEKANQVLKAREKLLEETEKERAKILQDAQQEAIKIKNQTRIIQQARQEAAQFHAETKQECEELRQATLQELATLRQQASTECEQLRKDADDYAASVLINLEDRLLQMLKVTRNGRSELQSSPQEVSSPSQRKKPRRKAS